MESITACVDTNSGDSDELFKLLLFCSLRSASACKKKLKTLRAV